MLSMNIFRNHRPEYMIMTLLSIGMLTGCGQKQEIQELKQSEPYVIIADDIGGEAETEVSSSQNVLPDSSDGLQLCIEDTGKSNWFATNVSGSGKAAFDSVEAIVKAAGVRASCQDSPRACTVHVFSDSNPYDVKWDFGTDWNEYVDACDWSLVFDAEYYKKAYPMLAILYNNDDTLLLEHFATIGVHEGRQGSAQFNVEAYIKNMSSKKAQKAFCKQVEGAYIYYMLHYDTEADTNTVSLEDGTPGRTQLFNIYTCVQNKELEGVNKYRAKANSADIEINGELCALANYRAYVNASGDFPDFGITDYDGHKWAKEHNDLLLKYGRLINPSASYMAENTVTGKNLQNKDIAFAYYCSPEHYEAMVSNEYTLLGTSNVYYGSGRIGSVFDFFID